MTEPTALAVRPPSYLFNSSEMTPVGWRLDKKTTFEDWQEKGLILQTLTDSMPFWVGDWCNHGEARFGEKYANAIRETGKSLSTVQNYAYTCKAIPIERRREALSFGHHAAVAGLPPRDQDKVLAWAEESLASVKATQARVAEIQESRGKRAQTRVEEADTVTTVEEASTATGATETPSDDATGDVTVPEYGLCQSHGMVILPHKCVAGDAKPLESDDGDAAPPTAAQPKATPTTATLVPGGGKLTKAQAIAFLEQHEREIVEDAGDREPEWLGSYIAWLMETLQRTGGALTVTEAFAAGYEAAQS